MAVHAKRVKNRTGTKRSDDADTAAAAAEVQFNQLVSEELATRLTRRRRRFLVFRKSEDIGTPSFSLRRLLASIRPRTISHRLNIDTRSVDDDEKTSAHREARNDEREKKPDHQIPRREGENAMPPTAPDRPRIVRRHRIATSIELNPLLNSANHLRRAAETSSPQ